MERKPNVVQYIKLRDSLGLTNYRVSKETGIAQQTLSSWEKGKYSPKRDKIYKLAAWFGVPEEYFYEEGKVHEVYDVAAGQGRINETSAPRYITVPDDESTYATIRGDSMYPILHDGDVVRVIPSAETFQNELTIVKVNGNESTCKYVELTPEGIWLRAENKDAFEDKFYTMQECLTLPVQIIGKAVEIISRAL